MPANLTPEYRKAEEAYRQATSSDEKIACLEHMLRVIPKHKGTDHLQADLKSRIAKLRQEGAQGRKKGGGRRDPFHVAPSGAGQVVLLGTPNVGKSAIVKAVTKAHVDVAPYPFSTTAPVPGIAYHEDVPIQLVDMPPVMEGALVPGADGTIRMCDIVLLVVDLSDDCLEGYEACLAAMAEKGMCPVAGPDDPMPESGDYPKITVLVGNKIDADGAAENLEAFRELYDRRLEVRPISAETGEGLKGVLAEVFDLLRVVRVYAKRINQEPDLKQPFILPRGSTVADMAREVHRDLPEQLKFAKIWGANAFPGQQVQSDFALTDKDVVELHT